MLNHESTWKCEIVTNFPDNNVPCVEAEDKEDYWCVYRLRDSYIKTQQAGIDAGIQCSVGQECPSRPCCCDVTGDEDIVKICEHAGYTFDWPWRINNTVTAPDGSTYPQMCHKLKVFSDKHPPEPFGA